MYRNKGRRTIHIIVLLHIHNIGYINIDNTDDGGQAMGEDLLKHVQMGIQA